MEVTQINLWIVVTLVLVALAFDFMNGFHDAVNSITTGFFFPRLEKIAAIGNCRSSVLGQ